jgi:hypothetical protein
VSEMWTALFFTEDDASRKNRKKKNPVSEMETERGEPSVRKDSEQKSRPKQESRTERPETKCQAKYREVGTKRGTKIKEVTRSQRPENRESHGVTSRTRARRGATAKRTCTRERRTPGTTRRGTRPGVTKRRSTIHGTLKGGDGVDQPGRRAGQTLFPQDAREVVYRREPNFRVLIEQHRLSLGVENSVGNSPRIHRRAVRTWRGPKFDGTSQ